MLRTTAVAATAALLGIALAVRAGDGEKTAPADEAPAFTEEFGEDDADLADTGTNPYFVLQPGYVMEFEGKEGGKAHHLTITVLDKTKKVAGVKCRVVEERETEGDELIEISRNYFAISTRTNAVYYFGEDVDMYKDGEIVNHEGSWLAGVDGAKYGMIMPGVPLLGARYAQEVAPKVAMDRAEIVSLDRKITTPLKKFENVLKTEETSVLEPGNKEYKYYAKDVGLIRDGDVRLVKYGFPEKK